MDNRRDFILKCASLAGTFVPALLSRAHAEAPWAPGPVRIFTPFPPGSGPDAALRFVSEQLEKRWARPVVIENRPGGNGFIAVAAFKQGATDGRDLIQLDNTHVTTHPHTFTHLPYDVQRDFVPLSMLLRTSFFIVVSARSRFNTLDAIVAAAREQPGRITYGSWFNGSPGHIGALRLQAMKDIHMVHVPFRDFGQLYAAVASQEVDWALGSIASAGGLERAGKLRFIALAAATRDPQYPDVPATAESDSLRGYEVSGWTGVFGPPGLSPATRDRLAADIADSLAAPETVERYRTLGYEAPKLGPDEFAQLIRQETDSWGEIVREAHLRLD
ncbi:Tripartite-type tricarboxylate transporter, receptor component TctC [Variovorax sp. HW608]|uniref:Bug family tripartite tricarboxylate transporter substrate binding protein n=1 Tax=Variovorax sp. HW608 TaxID=1034889 RepID=UPI00081F87C9|nr:tripartite tricarboxylate transporter substrate binding protein [Variovorax sp. HW608]SCK24318.1 Tripartite-type tricarboxylate transporter, receptor component TctC [Variovorax sp. HW608]